jgi:hypothetical protein
MKRTFNDELNLAVEIAESSARNPSDMAREIHALKMQNKELIGANEKMKSLIQRWINSVDISYAWDQKQLSVESGEFLKVNSQ